MIILKLLDPLKVGCNLLKFEQSEQSEQSEQFEQFEQYEQFFRLSSAACAAFSVLNRSTEHLLPLSSLIQVIFNLLSVMLQGWSVGCVVRWVTY